MKGLRALFSAVGHIQVRNLSVWIFKIEIWLNCLKSLHSSKKLFLSWPFFEFCFLVYEKNILQMMKETVLNTTIAIYSLIGTDWHLQKKKTVFTYFRWKFKSWFPPKEMIPTLCMVISPASCLTLILNGHPLAPPKPFIKVIFNGEVSGPYR